MTNPSEKRRPRLTVDATDEDFGNMMISAIRYGLWRRTYVTSMTSEYIIPLVEQGCFSKRVLEVMNRDLTQYEDDRAYRLKDEEKNKWALDDECDYQAWTALHKVVHHKLLEMEGEMFKPKKEVTNGGNTTKEGRGRR